MEINLLNSEIVVECKDFEILLKSDENSSYLYFSKQNHDIYRIYFKEVIKLTVNRQLQVGDITIHDARFIDSIENGIKNAATVAIKNLMKSYENRKVIKFMMKNTSCNYCETRMSYYEYKHKYKGCRTKHNSYDPTNKTIIVLIPCEAGDSYTQNPQYRPEVPYIEPDSIKSYIDKYREMCRIVNTIQILVEQPTESKKH